MYLFASGMVQAGERIVDRGEIIDGYTYNVLRSLKIVYEKRQEVISGWEMILRTVCSCGWESCYVCGCICIFPCKDFS